jgi:hypothetical protein
MSTMAVSLDHPTVPWTRAFGPLLHLGWLEHGNLTEPVPDWFVDFSCNTRALGITDDKDPECAMTSVEESWVIYECARLARPRNCLEVGIMRGGTTVTLGRALHDHAPGCRLVSLDIYPDAVEAARLRMARNRFEQDFQAVQADSRAWIPSQKVSWEYAFIDADHTYDAVVADVVNVYNKLAVGGYITMHDVGSVQWNCHQEPGIVFFKALDRALGEGGALGWLDSTERNQDMQIHAARGKFDFIAHVAKSVAGGWGGIGIIHKLNDDVRLSPDAFLDERPASPPAAPPPEPMPRPPLLRRAARKIRRKIAAFVQA